MLLRTCATFGLVVSVGLGTLTCGERTGTTPEAAAPAATTERASEAPPTADAPSASTAPETALPHPFVTLDVAGLGKIRIELLPEKAPETVANFEKLAKEGFYDGTTFHRVVPGFVIQGGDPNSKNRDPRDDGKGGPGYTIADEKNDLKHERGMVAMANKGAPGTAGSQFYIVLADQPDLDGRYTLFGRVTEGMDIVDQITRVEIDTYGRHGPTERPVENVVITQAAVEAPAAADDATGSAPAP